MQKCRVSQFSRQLSSQAYIDSLKYKTGSSVLDWPACHCLDGETLCESCAVSTLTNAIHSCRAVLALQRVYEEVLEEYCAGRLQHEKDARYALSTLNAGSNRSSV